jgi:hypothetical protein
LLAVVAQPSRWITVEMAFMPEDGIDVGFVIEIGAEIPLALVPIRRWIAI